MARRETRVQRAQRQLSEDAALCTCPNPACQVLNGEAMDLVEELRALASEAERQTTIKGVQLRRLKGEGDKQPRAHKHYQEAKEVLEYWKAELRPTAREHLKGDRMDNVLARLDGEYTVAQLKKCVDGYKTMAYIVDGRRRSTGSPANWKADAELIFSNAKRVDTGMDYADEAERRAQPVPRPENGEVGVQLGMEETALSNLGQQAVRLARFGIYVFPIMPQDKMPLPGSNGFKDATTDIDRIAKFWYRNPEHNVGIRCGVESELVVLDVDGEEGISSLRALEEKYGPLPKTHSIVTPSGGQHYYFHHPGGEIRNTTGYPGPGLDIRGDGGYVLAEGSRGANGKSYEGDEEAPRATMPDWLKRLLLERQAKSTGVRKDYAAMVRNGVDSGERNAQLLSLAGHLWNHEHEPHEVFELVNAVNKAKCRPPLEDREIEKIVESVGRMRARQALKEIKETNA